jgi:hypothetical protein
VPWNAETIKKHNRGLTGAKAEQTAKVANAILKETGDEGKALRIANWQAKRKKLYTHPRSAK